MFTKSRGVVLLVVLVLAGLGSVGFWLARRPLPVDDRSAPGKELDPRRAYAGPLRNINPDVRYVGDAQCAGCHEDIAKSYARHPMGRSLVPAALIRNRQRYTPDTHNPFTAFGRSLEAVLVGDRLLHRQAVLDPEGRPVVELAQEVQWAIGSGRKGYSYLTERDGYLLQTAISWFSQQNRWDLSPGYGPPVMTGRIVSTSCLFCHANRLYEHPEYPDRFVPPVFEGHAIGCERCHGPGELHANGDGENTIANPARLSPALRDAVCEQCHLEGEGRIVRSGRALFDYRPGLPLSEFLAVLVPETTAGGDEARAVSHVEQMYESKCFARSAGKLGCITCHDPHVFVGQEERETYYRAACLKCHESGGRGQGAGGRGQEAGVGSQTGLMTKDKGLMTSAGCSMPVGERRKKSPGDSCIDCHMPRHAASDIPHTASTDHRVPRRPAAGHAAPAAGFDGARFVDFYRDRFPQGDPQAERTLGLGLVKLMNAGMLPPARHASDALALMESALVRQPSDSELRRGKVQAMLLSCRYSEALPEARAALAERPGDWRLLEWAATAAQAERQTEQALSYWRRAADANPALPDYLLALLIRAGQTDEARERCRKLLEIDPFSLPGRQAWVGFLLQQGKKEDARREFDIIRRLRPPDLAEREKWFAEQVKE
jgi:hypothetical protein